MPKHLLLRFSRSARKRAIGRANEARDRKNPVLAARLYHEVIERWGPDFGILVQLGNALKDSGAYGEAEKVYSSALHLNPVDADCHLQFGHLMKLRGDLSRAREYYAAANRLNPHLADAREELRALESGNSAPALEKEDVSPPLEAMYTSLGAGDFTVNELDTDAQTALILNCLLGTFQWRRR